MVEGRGAATRALARLLAERGLKREEAVAWPWRRRATRRYRDDGRPRVAYFQRDASRKPGQRPGAHADGTADRRILYHAAAIEHALGNDQDARRLLHRARGNPRFDLVAAPAALALSRELNLGRS